MPLQLPADQKIEFLVGAAKLDIGLERDRIVALGERVQELVDRDRLPALITIREVVALEHARDRVFGGETDHSIRAERGQPRGVVCDLGLFPIEDEEYLVGIGLGVGFELVARKRRPGDVASGGIADHSGEIADQKMMWCPRSCSWRSLLNCTVWPRCRSGRVGSKPSLIRSGLPRLSLVSSSDSTISSSAPRLKTANWWGMSMGMAAEEGVLASATIRRSWSDSEAEPHSSSAHLTGTVLSNRRILAQSGTSFGRHLVAGRAAAIMLLTGVGVVAAFAFAPDTLVPTDPAQRIVRELSLPTLAPVARVAGYWREERIQRGDTLGSVLARLGIDDAPAQNFLRNDARARPSISSCRARLSAYKPTTTAG